MLFVPPRSLCMLALISNDWTSQQPSLLYAQTQAVHESMSCDRLLWTSASKSVRFNQNKPSSHASQLQQTCCSSVTDKTLQYRLILQGHSDVPKGIDAGLPNYMHHKIIMSLCIWIQLLSARSAISATLFKVLAVQHPPHSKGIL